LVVHEGYTDKAVIPIAGDVPTIGHGTTTRDDGTPVRMGDRTTPVAALARTLRDVTKFEGAVKQCVTVPLTQAEYDVYVAHAYNIGGDAFCRSTIVRRLNAGDYRGACDAILMWRFAAGKDCSKAGSGCPGLWKRRQEAYSACIGAQG
jgi:lysozyme